MALYDEILEDDDTEDGIRWSQLAESISVWAWMQQRTVTVAETASSFNTTTKIVQDAIKSHLWAFLIGDDGDPEHQMIEHDGD